MRFSQHRANLLHIIWSTNPNVNLEASHMCSACTIVRSEVKPYDMSKQRQTLRIWLHSKNLNHIHALVVQTCIIYPWTDHHKDVSEMCFVWVFSLSYFWLIYVTYLIKHLHFKAAYFCTIHHINMKISPIKNSIPIHFSVS